MVVRDRESLRTDEKDYFHPGFHLTVRFEEPVWVCGEDTSDSCSDAPTDRVKYIQRTLIPGLRVYSARS